MRVRVIIFRSKYCDIHKEKTGCKDSQAPILQLTKVYKVGGGRNFDSFQGKIVFFKKKKDNTKKPTSNQQTFGYLESPYPIKTHIFLLGYLLFSYASFH